MEKRFYGNDFKLGILGGGQLGRMFIQEAVNLNLSVHIIDLDPNAPCKEIASTFTLGDLKSYDDVPSIYHGQDAPQYRSAHFIRVCIKMYRIWRNYKRN